MSKMSCPIGKVENKAFHDVITGQIFLHKASKPTIYTKIVQHNYETLYPVLGRNQSSTKLGNLVSFNTEIWKCVI